MGFYTGGGRTNEGNFGALYTDGNWWSATEGTASDAYGYGLEYDDWDLGKYYIKQSSGASIRLLRD